jgi:3-methyl-2-oxobutanoate hydroxymethyltransferase
MPRFVKNFLEGQPSVLEGLKSYIQAVKDRTYPAKEHCFS